MIVDFSRPSRAFIRCEPVRKVSKRIGFKQFLGIAIIQFYRGQISGQARNSNRRKMIFDSYSRLKAFEESMVPHNARTFDEH